MVEIENHINNNSLHKFITQTLFSLILRLI